MRYHPRHCRLNFQYDRLALTDPKASGNRLAAHGLNGLLSIDLEGKTR